jgi:hypothetical protein
MACAIAESDSPIVRPPDVPAGRLDVATFVSRGTEAPAKKRGRPRRVPDVVPQQTWPEFQAVIFGLVRDGWTGGVGLDPAAKHKPLWIETPGEVALSHRDPGSALSLKLGASAIDDPLKDYVPLVASSYDDLRDILARHAGPRAAYLLNYVLARALDKPGNVDVSIDELVAASGPRPRTEAERLRRRREVWEVLRLFAHIAVYGRRRGYENAGEMLRTAGVMIAFTERADDGQLSLDGSEPPRELTYAVGPWLERLAAADPGLRPHFGNTLAAAQQSDTRPRQVWKKAIEWALNVRWREDAKNAKERRQGEDKDGGTRKTSKMQTRDVTRRDLLDYWNPTVILKARGASARTGVEPRAVTYAEILSSIHPLRAVKLWDDAIKLLQQDRVIGTDRGDYVPHGPEPWKPPKDWPKGKLFKPQGRQKTWLDQKITIRPGPAGQEALRALKGRTDEIQKAKRKARARPGTRITRP